MPEHLLNHSLYLIYLAMGFTVGFSHCIGMCGPITVAVSMRQKEHSALLPLFLYHAGRITTYTVLGGIMGLVGSFTQVAEFLINVQPFILAGTGSLLMTMGLSMMGVFPKMGVFRRDYTGSGFMTQKISRLMNTGKTFSYLAMGLLLGLLPCGPVYVALTAAAGSGVESVGPVYGMVSGMGIMSSFGMGTAPALLVLGRISSLLMPSSRALIYRMAGALVIASGVYFLYRGIF